MNRRNLLSSIVATLFGSQLPVAARNDNLAASLIPWNAKSLKFSPGVIANTTSLEVFLKNNLQPIANSLDGSRINANCLECEAFGVSIYIDPSGIFTNKRGIEGAKLSLPVS